MEHGYLFIVLGAMGQEQLHGEQRALLRSIEHKAKRIESAASEAETSLAQADEPLIDKRSLEIIQWSQLIANDARNVHIYAVGREPAYFYAKRWHVLLFVAVLFFPSIFSSGR